MHETSRACPRGVNAGGLGVSRIPRPCGPEQQATFEGTHQDLLFCLLNALETLELNIMKTISAPAER